MEKISIQELTSFYSELSKYDPEFDWEDKIKQDYEDIHNEKLHISVIRSEHGFLVYQDQAFSIYIGNLYVDPEFRGQGEGSELLAAVPNELPQSLYVFKENPAFNLYKNLGFIVTEDDGNSFEMLRVCV